MRDRGNHMAKIALMLLLVFKDTVHSPIELQNEINCLSEAIYFEARGQPTEGQLAVARVIIARKLNKGFPNTICKVVSQPYQFSFTQRKNLSIKNTAAYKKANTIAIEALTTPFKPSALFYHNTKVTPKWSSKMTKVCQIGDHIFYTNKTNSL